MKWLDKIQSRPSRKELQPDEWAKLHFEPEVRTLAIRIGKIVSEQGGINFKDLPPQAQFVTELGIDSLDYWEMEAQFETAHEIDFSNWNGEPIGCIDNLIKFVQANDPPTTQ